MVAEAGGQLSTIKFRRLKAYSAARCVDLRDDELSRACTVNKYPSVGRVYHSTGFSTMTTAVWKYVATYTHYVFKCYVKLPAHISTINIFFNKHTLWHHIYTYNTWKLLRVSTPRCHLQEVSITKMYVPTCYILFVVVGFNKTLVVIIYNV
jgi:hypothetical protein